MAERAQLKTETARRTLGGNEWAFIVPGESEVKISGSGEK
jgi:hypothetical protein